MKQINVRVVIVISFVMTWTALGFTAQEQSAMYAKLDNNEYKYNISGSFVDHENNPISGVTVTVTEYTDRWNESSVTTRDLYIDSSSFSIESISGCQRMELALKKNEYYPAHVTVCYTNLDDVINGGTTQLVNDVIITAPQCIVLTPIGRITPKVMDNVFYYKFTRDDVFREVGDQSILQVETTYPFWDIFDEGLGRSGETFNVCSESELPENLIYVWPQYDANNTLISVKLTSNVEKCYFLSQSSITNDTEFLRNMKLAPIDDGYEHDITILASEFDQSHYYYIYICTGYPSNLNGYYGKMSLSKILNGTCYIKLYINSINYDDYKREINPANL